MIIYQLKVCRYGETLPANYRYLIAKNLADAQKIIEVIFLKYKYDVVEIASIESQHLIERKFKNWDFEKMDYHNPFKV